MFGSEILDVALGIAFAYLLLSLVTSAVREGIGRDAALKRIMEIRSTIKPSVTVRASPRIEVDPHAAVRTLATQLPAAPTSQVHAPTPAP